MRLESMTFEEYFYFHESDSTQVQSMQHHLFSI